MIAFVAIAGVVAVGVVEVVVVGVIMLRFISIDGKCWLSLRFIELLFVPFRFASDDRDDDEVISK